MRVNVALFFFLVLKLKRFCVCSAEVAGFKSHVDYLSLFTNETLVNVNYQNGSLEEERNREAVENQSHLERPRSFEDWKKKSRWEVYYLSKPEHSPWAVALGPASFVSLGKGLICSGTLLTMQWVLTAAHCFDGAVITKDYPVVVVAGAYSKQEYVKIGLSSGAQVRPSTSVHVYPSYKGDFGVNDIATLRLDKPFEVTKTVRTIGAMWIVGRNPWRYGRTKFCEATGFGMVEAGKKNKDDSMRKTHYLEMESPCRCGLGGGNRSDLSACNVPKEDVGMCFGDSGAGLICSGEIVGVLVGGRHITSVDKCDMRPAQNRKCGAYNTVSVFIQLDHHHDWIYNTFLKVESEYDDYYKQFLPPYKRPDLNRMVGSRAHHLARDSLLDYNLFLFPLGLLYTYYHDAV